MRHIFATLYDAILPDNNVDDMPWWVGLSQSGTRCRVGLGCVQHLVDRRRIVVSMLCILRINRERNGDDLR